MRLHTCAQDTWGGRGLLRVGADFLWCGVLYRRKGRRGRGRASPTHGVTCTINPNTPHCSAMQPAAYRHVCPPPLHRHPGRHAIPLVYLTCSAVSTVRDSAQHFSQSLPSAQSGHPHPHLLQSSPPRADANAAAAAQLPRPARARQTLLHRRRG
jgi:hypothetical protein